MDNVTSIYSNWKIIIYSQEFSLGEYDKYASVKGGGWLILHEGEPVLKMQFLRFLTCSWTGW